MKAYSVPHDVAEKIKGIERERDEAVALLRDVRALVIPDHAPSVCTDVQDFLARIDGEAGDE